MNGGVLGCLSRGGVGVWVAAVAEVWEGRLFAAVAARGRGVRGCRVESKRKKENKKEEEASCVVRHV
jgi:hypothetical protein